MKDIDLFKLIFMAFYATAVTAVSFLFFFRIVFYPIPDENQQYANLILGFLIGSGLSTFLGYYFGTSQSTKARTAMDSSEPGSYTKTLSEVTTESKTDKGKP